ncbi:FecR domain-containing protein [Undibacterium seohonense]|uniref:FecR domain-containing protein n=1 Tax=Undibacterium seohonense TaxID=1344950 RepID=A0ABR6X052_9BURK|nr:FecR family protein [Undibacterium seohonense]MBC3806256.1 FecR domain-containing protein [Undibacterium seohonense]
MQRFLYQFHKVAILAVLLATLSGFVHANEVAGTVSFMVGDASTLSSSGQKQAISRGANILAGQTILTGDNGHVHLKMIDGAFVSIRPSSKFKIEEYLFNASEPKKSKIKFVLEQGTARSITGKAGESAKESYRLNTPLAAIGIRGTDFVVQTEKNVTRVVVQSGAIVMTPLNDECLSSSFGPCNTPTARVLTAAMRDAYLELRNHKDAPTLIPNEKNLASPNLLSPPRPEEPMPEKNNKPVSVTTPVVPGDLTQVVKETSVINQIEAINNSKPVEPKPVEPTKPVDPKPVEPVVVTPVDPVVVVPPVETKPEVPVEVKPEPVIPAKIWWGRWQAIAGGDGSTYNPAIAPDRETSMSNVVFGLFREKGDVVLPSAGVAQFKLAESEVYLRGADQTLTAGTVAKPSLTIDFGNRTFDTSLTVNVSGVNSTEIHSAGKISFQGLFLSEVNSPDTLVAGTLSKNSDQAGYLFQRGLAGGAMIIGATRWVQ